MTKKFARKIKLVPRKVSGAEYLPDEVRWMYHGTQIKNLEKIIKKGLIPQEPVQSDRFTLDTNSHPIAPILFYSPFYDKAALYAGSSGILLRFKQPVDGRLFDRDIIGFYITYTTILPEEIEVFIGGSPYKISKEPKGWKKLENNKNWTPLKNYVS